MNSHYSRMASVKFVSKLLDDITWSSIKARNRKHVSIKIQDKVQFCQTGCLKISECISSMALCPTIFRDTLIHAPLSVSGSLIPRYLSHRNIACVLLLYGCGKHTTTVFFLQNKGKSKNRNRINVIHKIPSTFGVILHLHCPVKNYNIDAM